MVYLPHIRKTAYYKLSSPWIGPCEVLKVNKDLTLTYKQLSAGFNKISQGAQGSAPFNRVKHWMGANSDASPALQALPSSHRPLLPASAVSDFTADVLKPKQPSPSLKPTPRDPKGLPLPPHVSSPPSPPVSNISKPNSLPTSTV